MCQQPYPQYPNQFGGFQNHVVEPPMPIYNDAEKSSGKFFLGFMLGAVTIIIGLFVVEFLKRFKLQSQASPEQAPLPETKTIKTIKEQIPENIFDAIIPVNRQSFDEFLDFLDSIGFYKSEILSLNTANEVWADNLGNQIHFSALDFTIKTINGKQITLSKKDALNIEFNQNLLNFLNHED